MKIDIREVKLEIYTPEEYVEILRDELDQAGAGRVGAYSHVISYQLTRGYWKPLEDSNPYNGKRGEICSGTEVKMEIRCPVEKIESAVAAVRRIHPYEEPVINIIPLL